MAAPISPSKKRSLGKDSYWLVPTVANLTAPTVAEVESASGLNISGVLLADYEGFTSSTNTLSIPRVLIETIETEINGATRFAASPMRCTFQPQAAALSDGKKAYELLDGGFVGYAIRRQDFDGSTDDGVTAGQFVDVIPVEVSSPIPGTTTTGEDGIYIFTANVSVTGDPKFNRAVVA